ncbi:hypothetical protein T265_15778, partial [Opisthorchis viverrini]
PGAPTDLDVNVGYNYLTASWNYTSNCTSPRQTQFLLTPYDELGQKTGRQMITESSTKDIAVLQFRKCKEVSLGVRPLMGSEVRKRFRIP